MKSFLVWARNLSAERRRVWLIGTGVLVFGTFIKTVYFNATRGVLIADRDERHKQATAHLKEAHQFASWSQRDREERVPPLTPEQEEDLRNYLAFVAENSPMVFPRHGEGKEIAEMHQSQKRR